MIRFRTDIEGLRGVAVLLVFLDHLRVPGFSGGYVGVDVFFVVSGYLITSLLAAEYARNVEAGSGMISISGFYLRRARRILPAALTVIVAVLVGSRLLLNDLRGVQIQHDALWALCFGSNLNSISQATDYFSAGLAPSPFQHYWSLAVEEQFYLVWPALFLLVTRRAGARVVGADVHWRVRLALALGTVGIASLIWSVTATAGSPASAYFSPLTRAWELALGALIGIATTQLTQLPRGLARPASYTGVVLLVAACVVIDSGTPFPGVAALLPTLAAALLILGGLTAAAAQPLPNRALCVPPARFLGRIPYSIYLWHWPFIVFAAALYPTMSETAQMRLLILVITLAVSALSFYLVERPGRRITFDRRREQASRRRSGRVGSLTTAALGTCVLVAVFVGALSAIRPETSTAALEVTAGKGTRAARRPVVLTVAGKTPAEPELRKHDPRVADEGSRRAGAPAAPGVAAAALPPTCRWRFHRRAPTA